MSDTEFTDGFRRIRAVRRRLGAEEGISFVRESFLGAEPGLPLVIQPAVDGVDLAEWGAINRESCRDKLLKYGGILFRGFRLESLETFERLITAISGPLLSYNERSSPRTHIERNIYTSTDYPAGQEIFPHNENSYQSSWPMKIGFFCMTAPGSGGETPIVDTRKVLRQLRAATIGRFVKKRILYVRNFGAGFGLPWQTVFQTDDPRAVDAYCAAVGIETQWRMDQRLTTRQVRDAVVRHPMTRELVWYNHAAFFHVSTLSAEVRTALLSNFAEDELPSNTYYGDGTEIEPEALEELRSSYREQTVMFSWRRADVLLLDNMLAAHGRNPYSGPRKIVVAMSEPYGCSVS
jgi:alpha-ketoglutarate-dependent taurine dioxygenase